MKKPTYQCMMLMFMVLELLMLGVIIWQEHLHLVLDKSRLAR